MAAATAALPEFRPMDPSTYATDQGGATARFILVANDMNKAWLAVDSVTGKTKAKLLEENDATKRNLRISVAGRIDAGIGFRKAIRAELRPLKTQITTAEADGRQPDPLTLRTIQEKEAVLAQLLSEKEAGQPTTVSELERLEKELGRRVSVCTRVTEWAEKNKVKATVALLAGAEVANRYLTGPALYWVGGKIFAAGCQVISLNGVLPYINQCMAQAGQNPAGTP